MQKPRNKEGRFTPIKNPKAFQMRLTQRENQLIELKRVGDIREKLVDKAIDMANNPVKYRDYEKGWVAGQISFFQRYIDEK